MSNATTIGTVHGDVHTGSGDIVAKAGHVKPIALFDLDGTLADFDGAMDRNMRKLATPAEIESGNYFPREQKDEPAYVTERRRLVKRQPGFWSGLEKLPNGFHFLDLAIRIGYSITILTKAPKTNFPAWSEKVEWCHRNLPMEAGISVSLVENKGLVYGRVLVDDYPPYIKSWLMWRPRGLVLMPDQPWNQDFEHPQVVRIGKPDKYGLNAAGNVQGEEALKRQFLR